MALSSLGSALTSESGKSLPTKCFRAPWSIFWAGLILRVLYVTLAHTFRFKQENEHFEFGWEMGRIARSLATGYGYSSPFAGHTGPTAWVPPLYPLVLGGVFRIFGVYTAASGWVILSVNSLFSALTALTTWEIAARCFSLRIAKWSAWLWALYPAAIQYAVRYVWETTLTTLLLSCVLLLAIRMRGIGEEHTHSGNEGSVIRWGTFGLMWGLTALANPTLLLFMPVCTAWILVKTRRRIAALGGTVLAVLIVIGCITPWIWRNWEVFHAFVPMRSNLGVEMWAWNNPESYGIGLGAPIGPYLNDPHFRAYERLGEIAYSRQQGKLAMAYIRSHPTRFAALSLLRLYYFWASPAHPIDHHLLAEGGREISYCLLSLTGLFGLALALRNHVPAATLFAWAFALIPLMYYFVNVQARFRHPIEPLIDILSVYLFQATRPRNRRQI